MKRGFTQNDQLYMINIDKPWCKISEQATALPRPENQGPASPAKETAPVLIPIASHSHMATWPAMLLLSSSPWHLPGLSQQSHWEAHRSFSGQTMPPIWHPTKGCQGCQTTTGLTSCFFVRVSHIHYIDIYIYRICHNLITWFFFGGKNLQRLPWNLPPYCYRYYMNVRSMIMILWMEEILHQLIDGLSDYPIIYRVSTIQDGAGFRNHPQYHDHVSVESLLKNRQVLGPPPSICSYYFWRSAQRLSLHFGPEETQDTICFLPWISLADFWTFAADFPKHQAWETRHLGSVNSTRVSTMDCDKSDKSIWYLMDSISTV